MQTTKPLNEADVLRFLQQQHQEGRPSPTLREIAAHVGHKATLSVQRILDRLEQQGLIHREAQQARNIRLTSKALPKRGLLLIGQIAAGPLAEAIEDQEFLDLGALYDSGNHRGLRVKGNSMVDAHILDGDIAVIRLQETCNDGEIVAAEVDGEATLKRLFRRKDHVLLKPENKLMKPIRVTDVTIRGVFVGLIRKS